jgi:hypothetical protein
MLRKTIVAGVLVTLMPAAAMAAAKTPVKPTPAGAVSTATPDKTTATKHHAVIKKHKTMGMKKAAKKT